MRETETESQRHMWFGPQTTVFFRPGQSARVWIVKEECEFLAAIIKQGRGVSPWQVEAVRGPKEGILYRDGKVRELRPDQTVYLFNSQAGGRLRKTRAKQKASSPAAFGLEQGRL